MASIDSLFFETFVICGGFPLFSTEECSVKVYAVHILFLSAIDHFANITDNSNRNAASSQIKIDRLLCIEFKIWLFLPLYLFFIQWVIISYIALRGYIQRCSTFFPWWKVLVVSFLLQSLNISSRKQFHRISYPIWNKKHYSAVRFLRSSQNPYHS